mgnify:CR=1 FL=1
MLHAHNQDRLYLIAPSDEQEALIDALAKDPELRKTLHVFECPMAQGYGKWVQRGEKLENPYMGKSMPNCGSASKWEV